MSAIIDDTNLDNDHILAQKLADAAEIADDQVFNSSQDQDSDRGQSPVNNTNIDDVPQLEYDEHHIELIADREIDDDELEYDKYLQFDNHKDDFVLNDKNNIGGGGGGDVSTELSKNPGTIKANITSDGIIDDDFESELGGHETTELHDTEDPDYNLIKRISDYGIFELCGEDKFGRKTIICSACRLPHENLIKNSDFKTVEKFYDCLLKYILRTFDQYVDMDYVIIYFHHGLHSYNRPSYGWLLNAYRSIDRKYKKNLKALYIVHPTTWIKFLWPFLRSLISAKFSGKLIYINRLGQLTPYVHLENITIPMEVKIFDPIIPIEIPLGEIKSTTKFHVPLQFILNHEHGEKIPIVVRETIDYIKNYGLNETGIFRRTASVSLIKSIQDKYNEGQPVVFQQYGDVHLAACVLKTFLRDLIEPLMTFRLYSEILGLSGSEYMIILPSLGKPTSMLQCGTHIALFLNLLLLKHSPRMAYSSEKLELKINSLYLALKRHHQIDVIRDLLMEKLPIENYNILKYLIEFLNLISVYAETNLMTSANLAIVFGPNLAWSDEVHLNTLANISLINTFTEILITRYTEIFLK